MVPDGASFKREGDDLLVQGLNQQVLSSTVAPDGSVYFTLWGPRGGLDSLWRLTDPRPASADAMSVKTVLSKGLADQSLDECVAFSRSPRPPRPIGRPVRTGGAEGNQNPTRPGHRREGATLPTAAQPVGAWSTEAQRQATARRALCE